ncbi:MAG: hypothetical protein UGF89_12750 [Acutalibacteraceae bacterium]|nr:hypothetical protein [Acutalibacteraceae bacterium]
MVYISRGEIASVEKMTVLFRGEEYSLSPKEWEYWKNGLNKFVVVAKSLFSNNYAMLQSLGEKGLVSLSCQEVADTNLEKYNLLAKSILVFKPRKVVGMINHSELFVVEWLMGASFSLMTEEIVFLVENVINPTPELLGDKNKQNLVAKIYPDGKIEDNILVKRMSGAKRRDFAVSIILSLMKKGYVVLN